MPTEARERGATLVRALDLIRLLTKSPHTTVELTGLLGCSRRSVERLIHAVEAAGLRLHSENDGIYVYYSLPRATLKRRLGV